MMTSKEALIYVSKNLKAFAKEYGDKINKTDNEALQVLKQALERLNQLEEENQDLKNQLDNEQLAFDKLFESNQKLSELYAKLKQVIDILQVKRIQKRFLEESKNVDEYNKWISNLMNIRELTQEEYELLKEILEDES